VTSKAGGTAGLFNPYVCCVSCCALWTECRYTVDKSDNYNWRDDDDNPLTVGQVVRDYYWKELNQTNGDYGLLQVGNSRVD
jgi:hypothetical protein